MREFFHASCPRGKVTDPVQRRKPQERDAVPRTPNIQVRRANCPDSVSNCLPGKVPLQRVVQVLSDLCVCVCVCDVTGWGTAAVTGPAGFRATGTGTERRAGRRREATFCWAAPRTEIRIQRSESYQVNVHKVSRVCVKCSHETKREETAEQCCDVSMLTS